MIKERIHVPAPGSSVGMCSLHSHGLLGQNQHALLHMCVFPLLKVDMNCEWEAFYTCLLAKFFLVTFHQKL